MVTYGIQPATLGEPEFTTGERDWEDEGLRIVDELVELIDWFGEAESV